MAQLQHPAGRSVGQAADQPPTRELVGAPKVCGPLSWPAASGFSARLSLGQRVSVLVFFFFFLYSVVSVACRFVCESDSRAAERRRQQLIGRSRALAARSARAPFSLDLVFPLSAVRSTGNTTSRPPPAPLTDTAKDFISCLCLSVARARRMFANYSNCPSSSSLLFQ